jgi:hypothetical protein
VRGRASLSAKTPQAISSQINAAGRALISAEIRLRRYAFHGVEANADGRHGKRTRSAASDAAAIRRKARVEEAYRSKASPTGATARS